MAAGNDKPFGPGQRPQNWESVQDKRPEAAPRICYFRLCKQRRDLVSHLLELLQSRTGYFFYKARVLARRSCQNAPVSSRYYIASRCIDDMPKHLAGCCEF